MRFITAISLIGVAASAHAGFSTTDLSPYANYDTNWLTDPSWPNSDYPTMGSTYNVGVVPFLAAKNPGGDVVGEGIVGLGPAPTMNGATSFTVPIFQSGVQSLYTLVNSYDGAQGVNIGDVTLTGSMGSVTYMYIEGGNTRDHYFGSFVNTYVAGINATAYWQLGSQVVGGPGYVRNDMQGFIVPTSIGALQSVTFSYAGTGYLGDGAPLVFGLTTSSDPLIGINSGAVPGPAAILPFLGGLVAAARRRRRA